MYRGIGNLISDLNECTHLANGESKSEAFAKHFKDIYVSKEGYETRPVNTSGSSQIQTPPVQPQSAESDINNPIASNDVSSATFNTVSNDIPDTFVTPYHFTSPSFSPSISFQSTPSPSQLQCVQFQNSFTRSPDITSAPPNTVPNDNTYATGNSSNISTLPSPNFSPSIPFRPSPSPVQSQRFENILIGSSNFQSTTPNKVPNDLSASKLAQDETRSELNTPLPESYNDGMTGCSSILPTMEPTRLTNFNSFNVTQVEYSRSVCDPPVPQPDYHNYDNIDSNTIPIELDYVNNYDNGGDVSMANANANDLMF
ncbi:rho GTPase-activating protein gacK-like [Contarinia nasturtii]|uniref:rho GTPase-activating protein gacK-like n=1 Tax=Contarinia nasturtii TaxID=265458 RepID=UPI0012D3E44F|nr:rho GTPase-activating protein gacK-like [Contarinia nasturtii]